MKKVLALLFSASLIAAVFAGCSKVENFIIDGIKDGDLSVVSFNVAAPWGNAIKGTGTGARVKRFAAYMNAVKPDIIGTQEMNSDWMSELEELMPDYDSYGVKRGGDDNEKKSEMNSIFWLSDKYECVEQNTFWLSETPDKESRYEGAGCNRVCSYVMLRDKENDKYILALNTHLDNASVEAREYGANVILQKLYEIRLYNAIAEYTTVITGDFNDYLESPSTKLLADKYNTVAAYGNTYHDWENISDGEPIDFIFTSDEIINTERLTDKTNGLISDHWGIISNINLR